MAAAPSLPATQRAATAFSFGAPATWDEALKLVTDKPVPSAGEGEVVVRLRLRPVNPADGFCTFGVYPGFVTSADRLPATLGLEGMGDVAQVGAGVTDLQVRDR